MIFLNEVTSVCVGKPAENTHMIGDLVKNEKTISNTVYNVTDRDMKAAELMVATYETLSDENGESVCVEMKSLPLGEVLKAKKRD